jgi:MHS family proline/betaine transporter-like MFS transporter
MNKTQRRIFLSSYLGNFLEVYDFALCGMLLSIFGKLFFAPHLQGFLSGALIFALSCFMRPVGGYIIGRMGDRFGRKVGVYISILGMGISTLGLALLPTYESIGVFATLGFIVLRFSQAFFMGGEGPGAVIFLIEHLKEFGKTRIGGTFATSNGIGIVSASFVAFLIHASPHSEEVWRYAFLAGSLLAGLAFFIRHFLPETPDFLKIEDKEKMLPLSHFKTKIPHVMVALIMSSMGGALTYFNAAYLPVFIKQNLHLTASQSFGFSTIFNMVTVLMTLSSAFLFQKFRITRHMAYVGLWCGVILPLPVTLAVAYSAVSVKLIALFFFAIPIACIASTTYAITFSLFETKERYMLSALCINFGVGVFGGMQPLVNEFLTTKTGMIESPAIFLIFLSAVALIGLNSFKIKPLFWRSHHDFHNVQPSKA